VTVANRLAARGLRPAASGGRLTSEETMAHGAEGLTGHGHAHAHAPGEHEAGHPGELTYIKIAAILAVITIVEVAIYYFDLGRTLLVTLLLGFSAIKFATVVGYFMHLKFDDRRLTWIFLSGLVVGFSIIMALWALFRWHAIDYAQGVLH
jgi:cytochrome c oxidase subunit IV